MPMALAPGRPPDRLPATSTRPTVKRDISNHSQPEKYGNRIKERAHDVVKYREAKAKFNETIHRLREKLLAMALSIASSPDSLRTNSMSLTGPGYIYFRKIALGVIGVDLYKDVLYYDEKIVGKTAIPSQRTRLEKDEKRRKQFLRETEDRRESTGIDLDHYEWKRRMKLAQPTMEKEGGIAGKMEYMDTYNDPSYEKMAKEQENQVGEANTRKKTLGPMGILTPRSRHLKKFTTTRQKTLTKIEKGKIKNESSDLLDESNINLRNKNDENEENSGKFINCSETSEKLQNEDRKANSLEKNSKENLMDKIIIDERNCLLELDIKIEKKIDEHYKEKKLILLGEVPGKLELKMARRYKYTLEEWRALNSYIGTTILKNSKTENGRSEEQCIIVKKYEHFTVRHKVRKREWRVRPKSLSAEISIRSQRQFKKRKKDPPRKEGMERLGTIKEENKETAIHFAPSYRGNGVKFHSAGILRLGRKDDRYLHFGSLESKREEKTNKVSSIMYQQPERDRRHLLDYPHEKKNIAIEFKKILYHVPLPQPQDRPPDYIQEGRRSQDRPPDCPPGAAQRLQTRYRENEIKEKEKQKIEDWGRESTLLSLRYSDRPPFDPPDKCRPRKKETTEILYQLRYIQRPPFLDCPPDCPPGASHRLQKRDRENYIKDKEKQKEEDWGRESTLLFLRYSDRPPFDPPIKIRPRKNETTEILYLLRYIQRPPFLKRAIL